MLVLTEATRLVLCKGLTLKAMPESKAFYAFDTRSGDHYALNESAYWALQQVTAGASFGETLAAFSARYSLPAEEARTDLAELMEDALKNGILQEEGA